MRRHDRVLWLVIATIIALVLFLSTLQTDVNGSRHAYAEDVGEIQNALPRWGLIHRSGYPLYTATGSLFVTVLRWGGIEPAAGASLFSTLWGVVTVGLLVVLAQELGVSGKASALGALATAVSTSVWVDASLAEVHTLTLAFSAASLLFGVRFGHTGKRRDLLLLTLFLTQGMAHQRSVVLLAPAIAVLIWPQLHALWRNIGSVIGIALLAPLSYLYMPLRVWTGATWIFGSPGTWRGFWKMILDNRAERVFGGAAGLEEWLMRMNVTLQILADDMLWPLLVLGLAGLVMLAFMERAYRESLSLTLAWIPNVLLTLLIWRGRVIDAQLAAKLPVLILAGVGLALNLEWLRRWSRAAGTAAAFALTLVLVVWGLSVRSFVLSITRDPSAGRIIATTEQVARSLDSRPTTLVAPWGHDYWALCYAQEYRNQLTGLDLVDHNADFRAIVERGNRLLVLDETLRIFPVSWWEDRLGPLYLSSAAPGVIEMSPTPPISAADVPAEEAFDLGNGLSIRSATLKRDPAFARLFLIIYWEVVQSVVEDYSVAVHLVARDPPQNELDVLGQRDSVNPVGGWYPTSCWERGEVIRDDYVLNIPPDSSPVAVRIAMYQLEEGEGFVNTRWLSLPVPE